MSPSSDIGLRLRILREAAGYSQSELAAIACIPFGTLQQIEQGRRADPRSSTIVVLALALGATTDQILMEDDLRQ